VGQRRDASGEHDPGEQEKRGEPVGRTHAVVAVFSRHGEAQIDSVRRRARSRARSRQEQQAEPVEAAMWAAMDGLAQFSQASVIHCVSVFVRLEAIRTEKH
jgi:hypothetical protein